MIATLLPIVTLVKLVQPSNAEFPMLVTLSGMVNVGQTGAMFKRIIPNTRNTVTDDNAGQTAAVSKRLIPNARNAVWDGHAGQTAATIKRIHSQYS